MSKNISRRHLLKFVGGSAAGVLLTPLPWKTLDDLAIWTQNGPWIPVPPRGEVKTRFSTCTLCPAACGVRARCIGGRPVSLSGVGSHPVSRGSLCPAGLGGHHLAYHPARLVQPVQLNRSADDPEPVQVQADAALETIVRVAKEIRASGSSQKIAVLDQVPGRTISLIYGRFLGELGCGVYLNGALDRAGMDALAQMLPGPWGEPGYDLENAATLLSFGTPILDGWGSRTAGIAGLRGDDGERKLRIIQVEPRRSRTAAAADLWLPIKPGTEAALALGIAQVLVREQLIDEKSVRAQATDFDEPEGASYKDAVQGYTPENVSQITGLAPADIIALARELATRAPAVVIGGGDPAGGPLGREEETAIWGLNLLLGSVGRRGGIVARRDVPQDPVLEGQSLAAATRIEDVPDGSIRLLITDPARSGTAVPWTLLEKKLVAQNALVVALSPVLAGDAMRAHLVLPAPGYMEALDEAATPPDSAAATFSVSQALLPPAEGAIEPAELIGKLASALSVPLAAGGEDCSLAACLKRKAEAIYKTGRGSVFSPAEEKATEVAALDSADTLWNLLNEGGCWIDAEPEPKAPPRYSLLGRGPAAYDRLVAAGNGRLHSTRDSAPAYPLLLVPSGVRGAIDDVNASPLMTKPYQESGLRRLLNQADINPETARSLGLSDRAGALVETPSGTIRVEIRFDPGVMPGVVHVALGPSGPIRKQGGLRDRRSVLAICPADTGGVWRVARAKVREA